MIRKSGVPSSPLGSNLSGAYRALVERLHNQKGWNFAKMVKDVATEGTSWTHSDLVLIAKGSPVIYFDAGFVGTGPFEHISDGVVQKNEAGGFYATVHVPRSSVQVIQEPEFFRLFMRPWSRWRRFRWYWRHWT